MNASKPVYNPWLIAITVTLATFMELLDTSIANVALPHIAGGLATTYEESTWVLTSYLVANAVVLPLSAWLSRVFGRKNYYMACVALFTLSSLLCGLAPNLEMLIFFRVLQGLAGGGLAPVEQAILVDTFPAEKRAAAFGLYSMAIVTAPAIGPPLGGWITDSFSWRWVFLLNIPIGLISLFLTHRLVQDPPGLKPQADTLSAKKPSIDYWGIIFVVIGFGCLEVVLDKGQREDWLASPFILTFLTIAVLALILGIIWELRHPDPVVELRLLKYPNFAIANILYFLFGFILFGSTVLLPQMLQSLFGYSATDAGLVLGPGALVITCLAPIMVRTVAKTGPQLLLIAGFTILAFSLWHYAKLDLSVDYANFAWARAFQGLGLAFLFVPTSQLAYSQLPANKNNKASSLTNLFRNLGGSFGIAFVTTMLEQRSQFHRATLVTHIHEGSMQMTAHLQAYTSRLLHTGRSAAEAQQGAWAMLNHLLNQQAQMMGFLDCFWLLALFAVVGVVAVLLIQKTTTAKKELAPH